MGEREELLRSARNLLDSARKETDPKKARKAVEGAERLKRWAREGTPERLR